MTKSKLIILLLFFACETGPAGPPGPQGDPGLPGTGFGSSGPIDTILTSDGNGATTWKSTANLMGLNIAGSVGIGTNAPVSELHVVESSNSGLTVERYGGTAGLAFRQAGGTIGSPIPSSSTIGQLRFSGYTGTAFSGSKVAVEINAAETWSDTAQGQSMQFYTTDLGATAGHVRLRVSAAGHIGMYSTTAPTLSACGTTPTLANGAESNGVVTEGSGASGCVITFAKAYATPPTCMVSSRAGLPFSYGVTTVGLTITNIGALSSTMLDYICVGL